MQAVHGAAGRFDHRDGERFPLRVYRLSRSRFKSDHESRRSRLTVPSGKGGADARPSDHRCCPYTDREGQAPVGRCPGSDCQAVGELVTTPGRARLQTRCARPGPAGTLRRRRRECPTAPRLTLVLSPAAPWLLGSSCSSRTLGHVDEPRTNRPWPSATSESSGPSRRPPPLCVKRNMGSLDSARRHRSAGR
jgi:hypothetical protein